MTNLAAYVVCKAFLLKAPAEKREALFNFLSEDDQEKLHELPLSFYQDPTEGFSSPKENLQAVHFSWLSPIFRTFSETEIRLFLACLSSEQAKGIKKSLLFTNQLNGINPAALPFLQETLWGKISVPQLLPKECLPDSPLNELLEMEPDQLLVLIDLLGMHDLAAQVKQIIETARLKKIYAALSSAEENFVKTLLHRKEVLLFKGMELQKWDGKKESLRKLIHQRGINRLAKALYRKEPSLLWYVSHLLDIERGELLLKYAAPLEHVRAQEILIGQVVELLSFIQTQKVKA